MNLTGKVINFLGDSITEGYGTSDFDCYRFDNIIKRKAGLKTANNYGIGGTTIAHQQGLSFDPSYDISLCSRIYRMDKEADVIVVFGGTNDYGHGDVSFGTSEDKTPETFCGAVDFMMAQMIYLYPDSIVVFMTPARRKDDLKASTNPIKLDDAKPLKDYAEVIKQKGKKYGIAVLDVYERLGIDPNNEKEREEYTTDGLHFNNKGNEKIADLLIEFLESLEEPSPKTEELIMRNIESAQHIYAAKKNFIMKNGVLSESSSKVLIGHISDMHGDLKRFKNCIKYFNYFDIDFAVNTGDLITWDMCDSHKYFEDGTHLLRAPIYNCIGNHETMRGQEKISNEELHGELFSYLKDIHSPDNRGYYYVDFKKYKIRLIVINHYDYDAEGAGKLREEYAPNLNGKSYFSFRIGDIWGLSLDCGEDKNDEHEEYGHTVCCHKFRQEETEFIKHIIENAQSEYLEEGITRRIVVVHNPFSELLEAPFDIEQKIYRKWCTLLRDNIKPDIMISGHFHRLAVNEPGSERDHLGQPCRIVIGTKPFEDKDGSKHFIGTGFFFADDSIDYVFIDDKGREYKI